MAIGAECVASFRQFLEILDSGCISVAMSRPSRGAHTTSRRGTPASGGDQKILEIGEGTNEVQRMVIARHLGF